MYDASIGRFTGVDPISDQFAHVSVYNYAENEPVGHIDLWGLQKAGALLQGRDRAQMSPEERRGYDEGYRKGAIHGTVVVAAVATGGVLTAEASAVYWWAMSNPAVVMGTGGFIWGLGTDQNIPGGFDDLGKAARRLITKSEGNLINLTKGYKSILWKQWTGIAKEATIENGKFTGVSNGIADFIITKEGKLIIGDGHDYMSGHAKSVIAAGEIEIKNGTLEWVSNQSGHYRPEAGMLNKFLDYFKTLDIDISKTQTTTEKLAERTK